MQEEILQGTSVEVKKCTQCGIEKILTKKNFEEYKKGYFRHCCKSCLSEKSKQYYNNNPEKAAELKQYQSQYRKLNAQKRKQYNIEYKKYKYELIKNTKQQYQEKNKEKIRERDAMRRKRDFVKRKELFANYYKKNTEKLKESSKNNSNKKLLFTSPLAKKLAKYEEIRVSETESGCVEVKCAYCGKWIVPSSGIIRHRINACEREQSKGEMRIYCHGTQCRMACPTYRRIKYPKGFKPATSREVDPLIRQMCFERDNYECQKCGINIQEAQLHCHHIESYSQNKMVANDIDNVIILCKSCHKDVHKQNGCEYYNLRCKKRIKHV